MRRKRDPTFRIEIPDVENPTGVVIAGADIYTRLEPESERLFAESRRVEFRVARVETCGCRVFSPDQLRAFARELEHAAEILEWPEL